MKIAKLLMALIVASIFVVPALSMQDHGKDCCCDQNACKVCHKLIAIEKAGCHGPEMGPATDNAREQFCKLCMKSMMPHDGCGCEKSMMGCDDKEKQGCDGKDNKDCGCVPKIYFEGRDNQMPMMGE
jgi:hypothetical protein